MEWLRFIFGRAYHLANLISVESIADRKQYTIEFLLYFDEGRKLPKLSCLMERSRAFKNGGEIKTGRKWQEEPDTLNILAPSVITYVYFHLPNPQARALQRLRTA